MNEPAKKVKDYLEEIVPQTKSDPDYCQKHKEVFQELWPDSRLCESCLVEQNIENELSPIEEEEPYCLDHDQKMIGNPPFCEACLSYEVTGFAYHCSEHGFYNGLCMECHNDEWRRMEERCMTKIKRKNGYYLYKNQYLPSVSTILKSAGNSECLVQWACKQGGLGVIWGLSKIKDIQTLNKKLISSSCLEWAIEQALSGLEAEGNRVKDFGSRVHQAIECHLKREELDISDWGDNEKIAFATFKSFYEEVGFDPIAIETDVYSPDLRFAGRLDLVAKLNEEQVKKIQPYLTKSSPEIEPGLIICDFKTGSLYPKSQGVQLSAYAVAYGETYGHQCRGGLLINIARENPEKIRCHYFTSNELRSAFHDGFLNAWRTWFWFDAPKWFQKQEFNQQVKEVT